MPPPTSSALPPLPRNPSPVRTASTGSTRSRPVSASSASGTGTPTARSPRSATAIATPLPSSPVPIETDPMHDPRASVASTVLSTSSIAETEHSATGDEADDGFDSGPGLSRASTGTASVVSESGSSIAADNGAATVMSSMVDMNSSIATIHAFSPGPSSFASSGGGGPALPRPLGGGGNGSSPPSGPGAGAGRHSSYLELASQGRLAPTIDEETNYDERTLPALPPSMSTPYSPDDSASLGRLISVDSVGEEDDSDVAAVTTIGLVDHDGSGGSARPLKPSDNVIGLSSAPISASSNNNNVAHFGLGDQEYGDDTDAATGDGGIRDAEPDHLTALADPGRRLSARGGMGSSQLGSRTGVAPHSILGHGSILALDAGVSTTFLDASMSAMHVDPHSVHFSTAIPDSPLKHAVIDSSPASHAGTLRADTSDLSPAAQLAQYTAAQQPLAPQSLAAADVLMTMAMPPPSLSGTSEGGLGGLDVNVTVPSMDRTPKPPAAEHEDVASYAHLPGFISLPPSSAPAPSSVSAAAAAYAHTMDIQPAQQPVMAPSDGFATLSPRQMATPPAEPMPLAHRLSLSSTMAPGIVAPPQSVIVAVAATATATATATTTTVTTAAVTTPAPSAALLARPVSLVTATTPPTSSPGSPLQPVSRAVPLAPQSVYSPTATTTAAAGFAGSTTDYFGDSMASIPLSDASGQASGVATPTTTGMTPSPSALSWGQQQQQQQPQQPRSSLPPRLAPATSSHGSLTAFTSPQIIPPPQVPSMPISPPDADPLVPSASVSRAGSTSTMDSHNTATAAAPIDAFAATPSAPAADVARGFLGDEMMANGGGFLDAESLASLSSLASMDSSLVPSSPGSNVGFANGGASAPIMHRAASSMSSVSSVASVATPPSVASSSASGTGYSSFFGKLWRGGAGSKSRGTSPDASEVPGPISNGNGTVPVLAPGSPAASLHAPVPAAIAIPATNAAPHRSPVPIGSAAGSPLPNAPVSSVSAASSSSRGMLAAMAAAVAKTAGAVTGGLDAGYGASPSSSSRSPNQGLPTAHGSTDSLDVLDDGVDWEFWGRVMQDYDTVARKQAKVLQRNVQAGIPAKIRGTVWLLMSGARDAALEREFQRLLPLPSSFEKLIQRDLPRTFPGHEFFADAGGPGQEALYNVTKAYSLYDTEVGYCQGIAFVAGPLLLNMPDEEAFCVLVKLMTTYNLRELYTPSMDGLHLRLFQFDKLLEEQMPQIAAHLQREGIKSSMFASQWFMTLFAYRFPLELVMRVFDMIFAEGADVLLKFALAMMKRHEAMLLTLEFEGLLEYLKVGMFDVYASTEAGTHEFVGDAIKMKSVNRRALEKLAGQYTQDVKMADGHLVVMETLKSENRRLEDRIKQLEKNLELINQEHVDLANELIQTKVDHAKLREANEGLVKQVGELRSIVVEERRANEDRHREAMDYRDAEKSALRDQNRMLMDALQEMQDELVRTKVQFAESEADRGMLNRKLQQLRRAFE